MPVLASSAARTLPVRKRADLVANRQKYQGRVYWMIKEPVGLRYVRLEEEEYVILEMLDGRSSLDELRERFEAEFPPQRITLDELQQFIGTLHQNGLVIADAPGQGEQLLERHQRQRRQQWQGAVSNLLAIRLRGFDPDRLLTAIYPAFRWAFSGPAVAAAVVLWFTALLLVTVQFDVFQAKLPSFESFFAAENWIWLAVVLCVTKVLHEFGHALACKHFGGECHEMGMMFLVMTPCLYVNVSDSWMLPNKWHRAAIGAAGMYVELVLASVATLLWWFSEPGLLHYLCLSTMFVSSVSTLVFNANPLMRYDGYYILSDLTEVPNLRQKASTIVNRTLADWCLGLTSPPDPFLPRRRRGWFALYTIAAAVYRWVVTLSILWFLYKLFEPYRLEIIGQVLALGACYGLFVRPLWQVIKFFHVPGRIYRVKRFRLCATLTLLAGAAAAALFVPLPAHVYCQVELQPRGATPIYVDVPGRLAALHVKPGEQVAAGAPLAKLENLDLQLAIAQLTGERDELQSRLDSLQQQRFRDEKAALEVAEVRETLAHVAVQLEQKLRDVSRLELQSPVAGTILPPPPTPEKQATDQELDGELANWSGTPLAEKNLGALLSESTLLCRIGDPRQMEVILAIDQTEIERVQPGQPVEIMLDQSGGLTYSGKIAEVAKRDLKVSSARLSSKSGGGLETKTDSSGMERPLSATYQALVPLTDDDGLLRQGLRGQAKIAVPPQTLASRAIRYLQRTFRFEL